MSSENKRKAVIPLEATRAKKQAIQVKADDGSEEQIPRSYRFRVGEVAPVYFFLLDDKLPKTPAFANVDNLPQFTDLDPSAFGIYTTWLLTGTIFVFNVELNQSELQFSWKMAGNMWYIADRAQDKMSDGVWEFRLTEPQPVSFYIPFSKLKIEQHEEWFHTDIAGIKEAGYQKMILYNDCDATAFGLYLSWNSYDAFTPFIDQCTLDGTQKSWLLLCNCWRVAQIMSCNGFRRVVEQAMIDFAKAREGNCPDKATLKQMEKIVDITSDIFHGLLADIWIFHNAGSDCVGQGMLFLSPNLKDTVIYRLAELGGKDIASSLTLRVGPDTFGA